MNPSSDLGQIISLLWVSVSSTIKLKIIYKTDNLFHKIICKVLLNSKML